MDEYYRAVRALPAWLARPLSALPPDTAEQVHEIRLRVGCGVQLTIGGKPFCPAELPALQKRRKSSRSDSGNICTCAHCTGQAETYGREERCSVDRFHHLNAHHA